MVTDRDEAAAAETVDLIGSAGGTAVYHAVDVADYTQMDAAVTRTVEHFGGLNLAVNNAGVSSNGKKIGQIDFTDWNRVIGVDLTGVMIGMDRQIPAMVSSGGGAIVNISSIAGIQGVTNNAAYTSAKHAVLGATRAAALEWGGEGIRVNAAAPGYVLTPLVEKGVSEEYRALIASRVPLGRLGASDELADLIVFLLSPRASYIAGAIVVADGGFTAGYRGAQS
jgi:NAD(P)-dependent dehydrogenase (short-subunit alcohol dehydrogenase family)